jgi:hypothetical protein
MAVLKIISMHLSIAALVCVGGFAICKAAGVSPHSSEMVLAALIGVTAAELAMVPVFVVRGKSADSVVQGALVSTVIHLSVSAGGGLAVMNMMHPQKAFIYWLCVFYWSTLAGVCRVLMQAVKSAPVAAILSPIGMRQASET